MSYIEIRNLSKSFGSNRVLDGVDLDIEKGEVVAIIGPSGTGKSTLLRCLNRLEKPEFGAMKVEDRTYDLARGSSKEIYALRQETEMVFQQFNLFRNRDVLGNVMEGLTVVKKMKKDEAEQVALKYLEQVGLADRLHHYPVHLSGGQQQRVAIARALAMKPKLLLMDEPTSALDPELVSEVLVTIRDIAKAGYTILLVTHEMNFVRKVAHKIIFLENGHICANGRPEEIFERPSNERLKEFLSKIHALEGTEYYI